MSLGAKGVKYNSSHAQDDKFNKNNYSHVFVMKIAFKFFFSEKLHLYFNHRNSQSVTLSSDIFYSNLLYKILEAFIYILE